MVGPHGVDFLDLLAERHCLVYDELDELVRGGFASEQFELLINGASPRNDDEKSNLQKAPLVLAQSCCEGSARSWHRAGRDLW